MATRRQVSIFINGQQATTTLKGLTAEKRKINNELKNMIIGSEEYNKKSAELRKINGVLKNHYEGLRNADTAWQKLSKGGITKIAGLAAGAFAVDNIVQYGKELFNVGVEMEVLTKKAETVFGTALPRVTQAARDNAEAMGLTTNQYINAATAIGDLLIPMKFSRDEAAAMSSELVNLSGALSEWTGGQIKAEEVSRILSKALLGEREELKQLGISIQEADVKARLAEKGLEELTGEMLQQAKAAATLELVMEKSVDAQTAFANNADTMVRSQAELAAQIQEIKERLATALIPVFVRLVDIAGSVVDGIETIADVLGGLTAKADSTTEAFREQSVRVNDLQNNLVPLLDRYDELSQTAGENEADQEELRKVIEQVAKTVPSAITQFDEYGRALDINSDKAREFVNAQRLLLAEQNREAIEAQRQKLEGLNDEYEDLNFFLNSANAGFQSFVKQGGDYFERIEKGGKNVRTELRQLSEEEVGDLINRFTQLNNRIEGTQNIIKQLSGEPIVSPDTSTTPTTTPTGPGPSRQAVDENLKQLERLQEALEAFREDERLADLSEDQQKLERLRLSYQKQIDLAMELEAQGYTQAGEARLELERIRDAALLDLSLQLNAERMDAEDQQRQQREEERIRKEQEYQQARAEAVAIINETTRQAVLSEQELAILELNAHYDQLRDLAEQYGLDTLDIEIAYRRERQRIQEQFQEEAIKSTIEAQKAEAQALATAFGAISNVIGAAIDTLGDKSRRSVGLQKLLTIAQIGISTASGIAQAVATSAGQPFPANLVAITTSIAAVLGGIQQAKQAFSEVPAIPQFFEGGWSNVQGAKDGRVYRAQYIGTPTTGMLPDHPVTVNTTGGRVLASERGREYFVSNSALQNPAVLNYVKAIDSITRHRQYVDGGFTPPSATAAPTGGGNTDDLAAAAREMAAAIASLQALMAGGIFARIDDDTVIDLRDRQNTLIDASGGVL